MAETLAVLSQKGGTGKTTTVRTLADIFRRLGLDTLSVDLDPQGNLSDYFDVPANLGLAEAELVLGGKMGRELTLRRALRDVKRSHDIVLVDCPPALGLLTVNALVAADFALLSAEAQYFALQGVEQAIEVIGRASCRE